MQAIRPAARARKRRWGALAARLAWAMTGAEEPKKGDEKPKVRGRGACKFKSAFSGSGLLAWTNDDPESAPSKEALNPFRQGKDDAAGRGRPENSNEADGRGGRLSRRRPRSEEADRGHGSKRRARSESRRRRRTPEKKEPPKPRTQWVRVTNVPTVVQNKHLLHLFKNSLGGVVSCTVEDGTASVCFETPELAERAVVKYNNGEINGCTISVELDFMSKKSTQDPNRESALQKSPPRAPSRGREAASESPENGKQR